MGYLQVVVTRLDRVSDGCAVNCSAAHPGRLSPVCLTIPGYFRPLSVMEATICFWKMTNRMMRGTKAIVVAAMT